MIKITRQDADDIATRLHLDGVDLDAVETVRDLRARVAGDAPVGVYGWTVDDLMDVVGPSYVLWPLDHAALLAAERAASAQMQAAWRAEWVRLAKASVNHQHLATMAIGPTYNDALAFGEVSVAACNAKQAWESEMARRIEVSGGPFVV